MAKRVGPQCEAAEYEDLAGDKTSPRAASLQMLDEAIEPSDGDTMELSMKAPMSVQNRRISGRVSQTMRVRLMVTGDKGHEVLPRFGPS